MTWEDAIVILLRLRASTFGSHMAGLVRCLDCGEWLELSFDVEDILVEPEPELAGVTSFSLMGFDVTIRLPNSLDLMQSMDEDIPAMRQRLIELCIKGVDGVGREMHADQLPKEVVDEAIDRMAKADPQGDIRLDLVCPFCGCKSQSTFDIVSFFWSEINARASRLVEEVHILAQAYGWSESEILALSPWRRQIYLDLVGG